MEPQWWITATARSGTLASGASFAQTLHFDTSVLGGGSYFFSFLVRDADPHAFTVRRMITISFSVNGAPDDHFDAIQGGTLLPATTNAAAGGVLEVNGDSDAFRVEVTEAGTLEAWTTGSTNTIGSLLDADGHIIVTGDDQLGDQNFRLVHAITPGTYFIVVRGSTPGTTGAYTLHVNGRAGSGPFVADIKQSGGNKFLVWDGYAGQSYRVLSSSDLLHWNLDSPDLFTGGDLPLQHPVPGDLPKQFFRVHLGDLIPVTAASIRSSSSPANSADLVSATPGTGLTIGTPPNTGDTALLLNGAPLGQEAGVLIASAAINPLKTFVAQAPSPSTGTPPAGFPNGHWLATSGSTPNSDNAGVNASAAWFPFNAGWIGGRVVNSASTFHNFDTSSYFFVAPFLNFVLDDDGLGSHFEPDPNKVPLVLSDVYKGGEKRPFAQSPYLQGSWITCGAGTNAQPLVPGIRPQILNGEFFGLGFYNYKADGTPACTAPYNIVLVPWTTPHAAVGHVLDNGSYTIGSDNYTASKLTNPLRYHLNLPTMGPDLSKGTFLATAWDLHPACLITYSYPATGGIDITPVRLPLTNSTPTPAQCGFNFVYIPHNRTIFGPGE